MSLTVRLPRRALITMACLLLATIGLAAAWRWSPLHDYAEPRQLAQWLLQFRHSPWALLLLLLMYLLASALLFPNTILNVATILALGSTQGLPCALAGSMVAAAVFYGLGARYGQQRLHDLESAQLERLSARLRNAGVSGILMLRLLPLAPFSVVNLLAGALHVRVWPFLAGSFLGLLPGNLLVTAFGHQLRNLLRQPSPATVAVMAALMLLGAGWLLWLRQRASREPQGLA